MGWRPFLAGCFAGVAALLTVRLLAKTAKRMRAHRVSESSHSGPRDRGLGAGQVKRTKSELMRIRKAHFCSAQSISFEDTGRSSFLAREPSPLGEVARCRRPNDHSW
jgi:hypothetical protein